MLFLPASPLTIPENPLLVLLYIIKMRYTATQFAPVLVKETTK